MNPQVLIIFLKRNPPVSEKSDGHTVEPPLSGLPILETPRCTGSIVESPTWPGAASLEGEANVGKASTWGPAGWCQTAF